MYSCDLRKYCEVWRNLPYGVNDGVLLVDLGGGTADLVSYRVLSKEPLQLEEICIGVGGKCGGSSCDRALHELMMKRYGEAFSSLATSKTGPGSRFMEIWESIKRDFDGDDMLLSSNSISRCSSATQTTSLAMILRLMKLPFPRKSAVHSPLHYRLLTSVSREMVTIFQTAVDNSLALVGEQLHMIQQRNLKERVNFHVGVSISLHNVSRHLLRTDITNRH